MLKLVPPPPPPPQEVNDLVLKGVICGSVVQMFVGDSVACFLLIGYMLCIAECRFPFICSVLSMRFAFVKVG